MMTADTGQPSANQPGRMFITTPWSKVLRAKSGSAEDLNLLCQAYYDPLVCWAYKLLGNHEEAEDLVGGCIEKLLKQDFLKSVKPAQGRFRTFLLRCLTNYFIDWLKKKKTKKRGGDQAHFSLDDLGEMDFPADDNTPAEQYARSWAKRVVELGLNRLRAECERTRHSRLFDALIPVLYGDKQAPKYGEIGIQLNMSAGAVKMAASRMRRSLGVLITDEIKKTLENPDDPDELRDEVKYLQSKLAK